MIVVNQLASRVILLSLLLLRIGVSYLRLNLRWTSSRTGSLWSLAVTVAVVVDIEGIWWDKIVLVTPWSEETSSSMVVSFEFTTVPVACFRGCGQSHSRSKEFSSLVELFELLLGSYGWVSTIGCAWIGSMQICPCPTIVLQAWAVSWEDCNYPSRNRACHRSPSWFAPLQEMGETLLVRSKK